MDLSIIITSWNTAQLLADCLRSIPAGVSDLAYEIIVVDNASTDGSADLIARDFPYVKLIRNSDNAGFARANNQGLAASQSTYAVLLNSDTLVKPMALTRLVEFMERYADAGAVGPRLLTPSGEPQAFAFGGDPTLAYLLKRGLYRLILRRPLHDWNTCQVQQMDWISGACLLLRRKAIEQAGPMDEKIFMYLEDNDWCLRIRQQGWKIYYNPQVSIIHIGGQSLAQNPAARRAYYRSLDYFYAKHYGLLARWILRVSLMPYRRLVRY